MTIDLKRWEKLKSEVDRLRREADRTEGVLDDLTKRLKRDFGVETAEEAGLLAAKLEKEAAVKEKEYARALADFERNWDGQVKE